MATPLTPITPAAPATRRPTALIAEDEPLLAQALAADLALAWPDLHIAASVGDGISAVTQALALLPDVLFFDVRMPGLNGLDAAADIADQWPAQRTLPLLVFITAYDEYAVQAFERAAVDYLLKPLQPARLEQCLSRIRPLTQVNSAQAAMNNVVDTSAAAVLSQPTLDQLRALLGTQLGTQPGHGSATTATPPLLQRLQVSIGNTIALVPVDDVLYFEAADKYVRVLTATKVHLIRTPIKDLLPQLDAQVFWQIHRSTVVRASAIDSVRRDDAGRMRVQLRGRADVLAVSRLFAHLFKAM
jgi:DNA-binding LytR/AlgR family response regulator